MDEKTGKSRSAPTEGAHAAGGALPDVAIELAEEATKFFRGHLLKFLESRLTGEYRDLDWMTFIGEGSLKSAVQMVEPQGDCPLSAAQFLKIVAESRFGETIRAVAPSVEESIADEAEDWTARNQRRLALIRKSLTEKLSPEEESDLQELQTELDKRLESQDDRMLDELQRMKKEVEQLPDGP